MFSISAFIAIRWRACFLILTRSYLPRVVAYLGLKNLNQFEMQEESYQIRSSLDLRRLFDESRTSPRTPRQLHCANKGVEGELSALAET